ncbi:hypothetical protein V3564_00235 [Bartonella sp. B12(2025)]
MTTSFFFEDFQPVFADTVRMGDINFCNGVFGSDRSREKAVSSILAKDIKAIIAPEFGRIFFETHGISV